MSGIGARLKRIESQVILTEDQKTFERLKRAQYNLYRVSDEALVESVISTMEGKEPPDWVEKEFQAPIEPGTDRSRIAEAEALARQMMEETDSPSISDAELAAQLNAVVDHVQQSGLESLMAFMPRLQRLLDEGSTGRSFGS